MLRSGSVAHSYHSVSEAIRYGIVDYDWSNAKALWANTKPMNDQERLVDQAEMVVAADPGVKVFVYRNSIKALNWFTAVREKLDDPQYSGWFVKFKDYKGPVALLFSFHHPAPLELCRMAPPPRAATTRPLLETGSPLCAGLTSSSPPWW